MVVLANFFCTPNQVHMSRHFWCMGKGIAWCVSVMVKAALWFVVGMVEAALWIHLKVATDGLFVQRSKNCGGGYLLPFHTCSNEMILLVNTQMHVHTCAVSHLPDLTSRCFPFLSFRIKIQPAAGSQSPKRSPWQKMIGLLMSNYAFTDLPNKRHFLQQAPGLYCCGHWRQDFRAILLYSEVSWRCEAPSQASRMQVHSAVVVWTSR